MRRAAGEDLGAASARLQGLPEDVMPLHVVAAFFESLRPKSCSGVLGKCGIAMRYER